MAASHSSDREALLSSNSSSKTLNSYGSTGADEETLPGQQTHDQSVEDDVLPETSVLGRNLGWSSAYILLISRVIGSGIFATPGAIVRSVGSVGITLVLWFVPYSFVLLHSFKRHLLFSTQLIILMYIIG